MSNTSDHSQFDFSLWDFPEDRIWIHIPETEIIIKICTFVPVIICGLFGNYYIIRLIILNRALRTPTNLIIANMAVADFLLLLLCVAPFLINDFYQNYELGAVGCKMEGFLVSSFLITAVLNLSVVSYDRLTAIVLPSEQRLTMFGVKFVIAGTWFFGILLAMPLAFYRTYKVRQWKNFKETYCKENTTVLPKYWYFLVTIIVWIPLGIMLICYTAIFIKLDRYEKRNLNREHPLSVSYKKTVVKTLFIVVIVFIILRLPFTILIILHNQIISHTANMYSTRFRIYWYIAQYLMFLNAAVNPYIYGFNNDNFRRAYAQTPFCQCCHGKEQLERRRQKQQQQQQTRTGPLTNGQTQSKATATATTNRNIEKQNCSIMRILCCDCSAGKADTNRTTTNNNLDVRPNNKTRSHAKAVINSEEFVGGGDGGAVHVDTAAAVAAGVIKQCNDVEILNDKQILTDGFM